MNWNTIIEVSETICGAVAAILVGVTLGVSFALVVIVTEIGLIRF